MLFRHLIDGDGSCLYHAVAHQAGFIPKSSRGDRVTSNLLRQVVYKMMDECPHVCTEDGLSFIVVRKKANRFGSLRMGRRLGTSFVSHWIKAGHHSYHIC